MVQGGDIVARQRRQLDRAQRRDDVAVDGMSVLDQGAQLAVVGCYLLSIRTAVLELSERQSLDSGSG